ncbi:MAG TPA: glutathione synthase [Candidatus Acidoferrales bacterium]|nr:glutathione synthase [Candidatus Acidoferrales bacterium]
MAQRFLFIMDPIERILPDKDTTFVFMLESLARGHVVYYCGVSDLFVRNAAPHTRCRRAEVARAVPHYRLFEERTEPLTWFHAIFMRKDPPVDLAYLFATQILSLVAPPTLVLNDPRGLRDANEKLYALNFPEVIPPSIVSSEIARLRAFMDGLGGEMIIKPLDGCGGAGIFRLRGDDRNLNALLEMATDNGRRLIMGQQYLPAIRAGDKRLIVLDGEPLGATLRVPRADEHRGNIHVGGTCVKAEITARDRLIVETLAPRLRRDGLVFVGLDIIGDYLTEVNVTSPTGVQEINALNDVVLERDVIAFVERRLQEQGGMDGKLP